MSDLPSTARVVIIGGGVVGVSILYHLAKEGWTDCILLEKNELTAGSTWHAAGNVPNFAGSWAVMNMQRYGAAMYRELGERVDYPMNYHVTGSIRLAHSRERMQELEHVASMARAQGLEMEMCTPVELKERHPFMETHDLKGGLWDSLDGDIDPAQLTQAMAKGARDLGATILRFTPATGVRREGQEWVVETEKGEIRCDRVVNAAGYYAGRVGEWFRPYGGREVPMVVMSHQYFLTEEIPELKAWTAEQGHKVPLLRDVDVSYYLRQDKNGLNLGPYERNCKAHWVSADDPMPQDFSFQLYPDDLERLEYYIEDAMGRVPILGTSGVGRVINGPIPYAPDGLPLLGPMPGVPDAYEAHAFTFGIAQGGGAGKVMAEWIIHGQTEWDMWDCDPRRYTAHADHEFTLAKALETYGHEYAMHFPHHEWPEGRDRKLSMLHSRMKDAGAVFGAYNGWERANWYAKDGDDTSEEATQTWDRNGPWAIRVKEEVEAVRDNCGMLPITGFSRIKVEGPGARDFVDSLTASRLPAPGRVSLAYFPDARGHCLTEMSVMVHSDEDVGLITAATAQWHDRELFSRQAPEGITVSDHTDEVECLLVTGPKARDILEPLSEGHDLSAPWLSVNMEGTVAGEHCALLRVSFAGELGWEIHAAPQSMPAIWDALRAAGVTPFGMYALDSMRIEKGYRTWKGDLSSEYSLLEMALGRFVRLDKNTDFPGKAALLDQERNGVPRSFASLVIEGNNREPRAMTTIRQGGEPVGEVTSSAYGYRVDASIAHAVVRADLARPGTVLDVEIFGETCRATVQEPGPLWDPGNARISA